MASAAELPVDLLEEIFLRLDDAADLVRASAACVSFRRLVSDGGFVRRFRSVHHPPVLGLLSRGFRFHPAAPLRPSAQAARAVARAAGFSSSLPTKHYWRVHDARDGRVLLAPSHIDSDNTQVRPIFSSFSYLVVYDPLNHKHVQIPRVPIDLMACTCTEQPRFGYCNCYYGFDPFLIPAATDEDDLSFRVMCTARRIRSNVLDTFIYSSVGGKWCVMASLSMGNYKHLLATGHYAHGFFYWVDSFEEDMLVLDMNAMEFSFVRLPPETEKKYKVVVKAAEEDRIGFLVLRDNTLHLYTKAIGGANDDGYQWRHNAEVTVLDSYVWSFGAGADQGYALLRGIPLDQFQAWRKSPWMTPTSACYFTVELRTLLVEPLCVKEFDNAPGFLYASFPPPFALPSL